jgi:hypothetical protein
VISYIQSTLDISELNSQIFDSGIGISSVNRARNHIALLTWHCPPRSQYQQVALMALHHSMLTEKQVLGKKAFT